MPEPDLALLVDAAQRAGKIALTFWGKNPKVWQKGDQGPVTEADIAVNDMLEHRLRAARPGYGWLSEESLDDPGRLQCEHVFIIDPIDGTRAFIDVDAGFSHSLAIARNGQITAAVVYLPAKDRIFTASDVSRSLCDDMPMQVSAQSDPEAASIMTSKGNLDPDHWQGPPPAARRLFRPSLAHRLCLVADGSVDALLTLRPTWEWDVAAGSLIASRAGASVTDRNGAALVFNQTHPQTDGLLVAATALHANYLSRLRPSPLFFSEEGSRRVPGA